jgi:hypothetical protein
MFRHHVWPGVGLTAGLRAPTCSKTKTNLSALYLFLACTIPRERFVLSNLVIMLLFVFLLNVQRKLNKLVVAWLFIGTQKKVSGPPLCPRWLTKRRTYRPRSVIYGPVSRQSSEIIQA